VTVLLLEVVFTGVIAAELLKNIVWHSESERRSKCIHRNVSATILLEAKQV